MHPRVNSKEVLMNLVHNMHLIKLLKLLPLLPQAIELTDSAKLVSPRSYTDEKVGGPVKNMGVPIKLLYISMFKIRKSCKKLIFGPVKHEKFSRCLSQYDNSNPWHLHVSCNMTYSQIMYCICATSILTNIFMLIKGITDTSLTDLFVNMISQSGLGWVGLWGFLWWAPLAKRKDHHWISSGWSSVWHRSNTGLSSTQYEQIPIILGVWPFWLTPFFFGQ